MRYSSAREFFRIVSLWAILIVRIVLFLYPKIISHLHFGNLLPPLIHDIFNRVHIVYGKLGWWSTSMIELLLILLISVSLRARWWVALTHHHHITSLHWSIHCPKTIILAIIQCWRVIHLIANCSASCNLFLCLSIHRSMAKLMFLANCLWQYDSASILGWNSCILGGCS